MLAAQPKHAAPDGLVLPSSFPQREREHFVLVNSFLPSSVLLWLEEVPPVTLLLPLQTTLFV
jgi:hypothetical protein